MKLNKMGWLAAVAAGGVLAFGPGLGAAEEQGKAEGGAGNRGAGMRQRMEQMSEELKLTDEQKEKVQEALRAQFEQMRDLRDATPEQRREKGKAMMEQRDKKMKEILKPEQYEKWQKLQPGGPGNAGATMQERFDRIAEQLNLTEEQKGKVQEAFRSEFETMRGLRDASPQERQEKVKAMMEEQDKKMKEILKPDQYEKWQTVREQLRSRMQQGGPRRGGGGGKTQG